MITKKVIDSLYKKYSKLPAGVESLDVGLLFDESMEQHNISIDENGNLVIGSIEPGSPFHKLAMNRVHGINNFENYVALILHSSILFLSKKGPHASINIKANPVTFWEKVRWWFHKN